MSVYQRIRERRLLLGLSQDELAIKLSYKSRSSINKIELGKTDITTVMLENFAKVLECTPAYLMGWTDDPADSICNSVMPSIEPQSLCNDEEYLVNNYRLLNTDGKGKVIDYTDDLLDNPKYTENPLSKLDEKEIG